MVEMCSRGLVNMVVDYIAAVVSKASLEGPLGLSNISLFTVIFVAFQHIYYIIAVACKFLVDLPCASIIDFYILSLKNIRASSALICALLHSLQESLWS